MKDVTVVITSCNRHDLLERTLKSFFAYNTYAGVKDIIIVEDGPLPDAYAPAWLRWFIDECNDRGISGLWFGTGNRVGQIEAIDQAYAKVTTPYVFHCEDDWEFYRPAFIEASKHILEQKPKCLQVWLRERNDTNGHPVSGTEPYGVMVPRYKNQWHGFSFNPGLRRMVDYPQGGYGSLTTFKRHAPWESEIAIGNFYFTNGYWAAILPQGYVKHTGDGRHVI